MSDDILVVTTDANQSVTEPVIVREVLTLPATEQVVVEHNVADVVTTERADVVVASMRDVQVITMGQPGPRGPAGPAGSVASTVTKVAAVALGGHRVVTLNSSGEAIYADNTNIAHIDKVLGVTTHAVDSGDEVAIQTYGELEEASFAWTVATPAVFLVANGLMSHTAPTTGFVRKVGFVTEADTLFIDLGEPVALAA